MFEAEAVQLGFDKVGGQFAVGSWHSKQATADNTLWRTAFVDIDMCCFGTYHGMMRTAHSVDAEDIGACSIKNKVGLSLLTKLFFE